MVTLAAILLLLFGAFSWWTLYGRGRFSRSGLLHEPG